MTPLESILWFPSWIEPWQLRTVLCAVSLATGGLALILLVSRDAKLAVGVSGMRDALLAVSLAALTYIVQTDPTVWDARDWWAPLACGCAAAAIAGHLVTSVQTRADSWSANASTARWFGLALLLVAMRFYADTKLLGARIDVGDQPLRLLKRANFVAAAASCTFVLGFGAGLLRAARAVLEIVRRARST